MLRLLSLESGFKNSLPAAQRRSISRKKNQGRKHRFLWRQSGAGNLDESASNLSAAHTNEKPGDPTRWLHSQFAPTTWPNFATVSLDEIASKKLSLDSCKCQPSAIIYSSQAHTRAHTPGPDSFRADPSNLMLWEKGRERAGVDRWPRTAENNRH